MGKQDSDITAFRYLDKNKYLLWILYLLIILLYSTVSLQSFGYDDEYFNINLIEKLGFKAINYLQKSDVHPPLSYLTNFLLFRFFNNWRLVRLFSGVLNAFTLIFVIRICHRTWGKKYAHLLFLLLALNPAILMWCTGIRWYAYFLPILILLIFQPIHKGYKSWFIAFAGMLLLCYTGYIAFLIFLPLLLLYLVSSDEPLKIKLKYLLYLSPLFVLLYSYQLYYFITFHLKFKGKEVRYTIWDNLRGYFASQISNQGIFPVSVPAVISFAGFAGISLCIIIYLFNKKNRKPSNYYLAIYALLIVLLIASGLGGKLRNWIVLIPFQVFVIMHFYSKLEKNRIYNLSVAFLGIANIWGCVNVFNHANTSKNSWNLPVREAFAELKKLNKKQKSVLIFTHDPTLTYLLQKDNYQVVSFYNNHTTPEYDSIETVVFLNTFRGSLNKPFYDSLVCEENKVAYTQKENIKIGLDKFYNWKTSIAQDYPQYQVEMIIYQNPANFKNLTFWNLKNQKKKWANPEKKTD